ncbi:hypothetical protein AMATHDRAFT_137126 [Amanita thiersii Skay4041]|uniref:Endonuclease III homolog n=1 Tax=Amanita thiersii Skay4041 TaxID=703135 RepID=A0A2A9NW07_9AGAR|nr:hypothetical protein AMATHDRAFT_137126 [Amanita thiersii Skay4041]
MPSVRRTAPSRAVRLINRPSPYSTSVTLVEAANLDSNAPGNHPTSSRTSRRHTQPVTATEAGDSITVETTSASAVAVLTQTRNKKAGQSPSSKSKPVPLALDKPHPAPEKWREVYDTIKEMRSRTVAPVDTMGCDQAQYKEEDPKARPLDKQHRRFATLVSLMLSSQTKDEITDTAVSNLRNALGGSLSVAAMVEAEEDAIASAISKVGFWRRKTGYLKKTALRLRDDFDSDVPKTVDELCSLPGVGPKMAFLTLQVAWNLNVGIGVDVHVHRITNRLGWHKPPTKNPEETRLNLQSWLPVELHPKINHLLVGFGQTICLPVSPRCDSCDLSAKGLCPSAKKGKGKSSASGSPKLEVALETEE